MSWEFSVDTLIQIVIAVIALAALFRPEIKALYSSKFGNITFHKSSALIEIGFFDLGPSIGISGTFAAEVCSHFIKQVDLKIVRESDQASYNFNWGVFRDIDLINTENSKADLAYPFHLKAGDSKNLNIQFHDIKTKEKIRGPLVKLIDAHRQFLYKNNIVLENANPDEIMQQKVFFRSVEENDDLFMNAYTKTKDEFYWKEGEYKGEIIIKTVNKDYSYSFDFIITEEEAEHLKLNAIGLVDTAVMVPAQPFFINKDWNLSS